MNCVTDVEYLVSLGYSETDARQALKLSIGDRKGALSILRKDGKIEKSDIVWRQELQGDWQSGVTNELPTNAVSRGLWKSPIYVRIGSFRTDDNDEALFCISVVLKDGRKWNVDRSYQHFLNLKTSLPMSLWKQFKNWFPKASFYSLTRPQMENRRQQLEDWFQELTMNEDAMRDKRVLENVYSFLKAYEHGGGGYISPLQQVQRIAEMDEALGRSHLSPSLLSRGLNTSVAQHTTVTDDQAAAALAAGSRGLLPVRIIDLPVQESLLIAKAPPVLSNLAGIPLALEEIIRRTPFSVPVKDLPGLRSFLAAQPVTTTRDTSDRQLALDYGRDRAVIQGRRLEGYQLDIQFMIQGLSEIISQLMAQKGCTCSDTSSLNAMARRALQQLSRTESAFTSFSALNELVQASEETLIVPESTLAEPVIINFRIMEKPGSSTNSYSTNSLPHGRVDGNPIPKIPVAVAMPTELANSRSVPSLAQLSENGSASPLSPSSAAVLNRGELLPWCIVCEGLANTVYRICDANTTKTKLQLKVSYRKTFYIMIKVGGDDSMVTSSETNGQIPSELPVARQLFAVNCSAAVGTDSSSNLSNLQDDAPYNAGIPNAVELDPTVSSVSSSTNSSGNVNYGRKVHAQAVLVELSYKDGATMVSVQREMHTSSRDWDGK